MKINKLIYWIPRILAIVLTIFLGVFALDVFEEYSFPLILIALFMHLIPNMLLIISLIIAWKKQKIGGTIFIILGIISIFFFKTYEDIIVFSIISLPILMIGILFLIEKKIKKK